MHHPVQLVSGGGHFRLDVMRELFDLYKVLAKQVKTPRGWNAFVFL